MIKGIYNDTLPKAYYNNVTKLLEEQREINGRGNGLNTDIIEREQDVSWEEVDNAIKTTYSSSHYKDYTRYQSIAKAIHQVEALRVRDKLYETKDIITKVEDIINRRIWHSTITEGFRSPKLPKEEMTIDEIQEYIKPENVSRRIVDFVKGLYEMWKSNYPGIELERFYEFFNIMKGAIDEGFKQAWEILGALPEDIESMINETYSLTMKGMDDWYEEITGKRGEDAKGSRIKPVEDNPVIKVERGESVTIQGQYIEAINSQIEIIQNDDGNAILNLKVGQSVMINGNLVEATHLDLTIGIGEDGAKLYLSEGQKAGINDRIVHAISGDFILALEESRVRVDINEGYTVKADEEEVEVIKGKVDLNIFQDGRVSLDISPNSIINLNGQEIKTDNDQITIDLLRSLLLDQEERYLITEALLT